MTDNERTQRIHEWLNRTFTGSIGSAGLQAHRDISWLLAENARLRAIEGAARAYAAVEYVGRIYESPSEWKAVVDALAAFDAAKGE